MAQEALRRDEALALLRAHREELTERFDVSSVYLFGSTARDRATVTSDVDILVDFNGPVTMKQIFDLQSYIEGLVDRPVDLVTRKELKKEIRPYVEAEAIDVSEENPRLPDSESPAREWRFRLENMIGFCEDVLKITEGISEAEFFADITINRSTLHTIALIGEAARHVPDAVRDAHPEVPWVSIIGTRNLIIHDYLGVDDDRVWEIIRKDIPELLPSLRKLLATV